MRIYALWLSSILNITIVSAHIHFLDYIKEFLMPKNLGTSKIKNDANSDCSAAEEWPHAKISFPEFTVQSPTDIDTTNAKPHYDMPPIIFHRTADLPHEHVEIENTGYYFGGPLFEEHYVFEQMHIHWGANNYCGSEHRVNGKCHSTEVHMVFCNKKYGSFEAATKYTDGVAVISFFGEVQYFNFPYKVKPLAIEEAFLHLLIFIFLVSEEDNPDFNDLCEKLAEIKEPHTKTKGSFKDEFEFVNVLFQQNEFYAFPGSLTTEPYQQCVTWIMYTNPFPISDRQLDAFRQLKQKDGKSMIRENDRPLQEFGNRPIVYSAFNRDFRVESHESDSMPSDESASYESHNLIY